MKKWIFVSLGILFSFYSSLAQQRLTVEKALIQFTSNAELEVIKASSDQVQGLIEPSTNKFAFSVRIISFKGFNSELQRVHFNEKYLESERFPTASFSGKIIEELDLTKDGTYDVRAKGELDIHGVKQTRIIKSSLTVSGGKVSITSKFNLPLSDHDITIPKIVGQKIATEIEVIFTATMVLK
ncbi:MAG: YceI family protein [Chryseolinea sp.]